MPLSPVTTPSFGDASTATTAAAATIMIVPSVPSSHTSVSVESLIYEIVESAPLPVIDMSRSIRSVYFSERFGKTWTSLVKRYQSSILISYYVAILLSFFEFFMDARLGQ